MDLVEHYENGVIQLRVYEVGQHYKFWLQAGAALLELDVDAMTDLVELLNAFVNESGNG